VTKPARAILTGFLLLFVATGRGLAFSWECPLGVKVMCIICHFLREWPMLCFLLGSVYLVAGESLLAAFPFRRSTRWLVRLTCATSLLAVMAVGTTVKREFATWSWLNFREDWATSLLLMALGYLFAWVTLRPRPVAKPIRK
jgi:hypothetical protein